MTRGAYRQSSDRVSVLDRTFPTKPSSAALARHAIREQLAPVVPDSILADAELLVTELVSNSIRHSGMSESSDIELISVVTPRCVHVEIRDRGRSPSLAPQRSRHARDSGYGLFLVDQLSSRWGAFPGNRTRVWFEIDHDSALLEHRLEA
ncbi:MAG: ATP-binding protein [Actinomycetota bacterium]